MVASDNLAVAVLVSNEVAGREEEGAEATGAGESPPQATRDPDNSPPAVVDLVFSIGWTDEGMWAGRLAAVAVDTVDASAFAELESAGRYAGGAVSLGLVAAWR